MVFFGTVCDTSKVVCLRGGVPICIDVRVGVWIRLVVVNTDTAMRWNRVRVTLVFWLLVALGAAVPATAEDHAAFGGVQGSHSASSIANLSASVIDQGRTASKIQWLDWGDKGFTRAQAEDKLILLDLTALWCHACHVMEETTYSNPEVIGLVNARFVPIRVETDRRPDIEARYRRGGWPTTSVLLRSGEILFQANFLEPEDLTTVLLESDAYYREHKDELVNRAAEGWVKVEAALNRNAPSNGPIDSAVVGRSVAVMRQSFDSEHGGFRDAPKFLEPEAITFAFRQYHRTKNEDMKHMALKTLDAQRRLLDPVWGGFYRYAEEADWTKPHYEKMLNIQAANLQNYLEAYQVTRDPTYRVVAERLIGYVERFLSSQTGEGFFGSQDADAKSPRGGYVAGEEYFLLGEAQRTKLGMPHVDRTVYTHWNGQMIIAYLRASHVLGNERFRAVALNTLNRLYDERYKAGLGMAHVVADGSPREFGFLADQVWFAKALIEALYASGDHMYLNRAESVATDCVQQLEDPRAGGFFDRPKRSGDQGLLRLPHKPVEDNLHASMLFNDLFYLTEKSHYRETAERTLRFVLAVAEPLPVALAALAVNRSLSYPVHMVVVGSRTSQISKRLFEGALRLYAPGKIVRFLEPGVDSLSIGQVTFPNLETPRAYICTDRLCSQPIADPHELGEALTQLLARIPQRASSS